MVFVKGTSGNLNGRPKGQTLKEFAREYLLLLTPEKKLRFLRKIAPQELWKMAEGSPHSTEDITSGNKPLPQPIYGGLSRHNSNKEDISVEEENSCN